jgi:hypothetical protein
VEYRSRWIPLLAGVYLLLQLTIPLRHWLYPGSVHWTEEGHRFAWHMKLRDKSASLRPLIIDPVTQQQFPVHLPDDLTERQIRKLSTRPDMIWQYARFLKRKFEQRGVSNPVVRIEAWAGLNGRPMQRLIDPKVNLAEMPYPPFTAASWILPLEEGVRPGGSVNAEQQE